MQIFHFVCVKTLRKVFLFTLQCNRFNGQSSLPETPPGFPNSNASSEYAINFSNLF